MLSTSWAVHNFTPYLIPRASKKCALVRFSQVAHRLCTGESGFRSIFTVVLGVSGRLIATTPLDLILGRSVKANKISGETVAIDGQDGLRG